jgi:hypothetical protein
VVVGAFVLLRAPTNKIDHHDEAKILLKGPLNTTNPFIRLKDGYSILNS